jgi:hypothetical protein
VAKIFERVLTEHFEFIEPSLDAIDYIASELRPGDAAELIAYTGSNDFAALIRMAVTSSDDAVVAISAWGEPLAVLGVTPLSLLYNTGSPWVLCTPGAMRHRRAFIAQGRAYTAAMLEHYDALINYVDNRNTKSVAWLQHIGYQMAEPKPYGAHGLPFRQFSKEK